MNPSEYIRAGIIGSVVVTCFLFLLIVVAEVLDWLQRTVSKSDDKWGLLFLIGIGISVSGIWVSLFLLYILSLLL